MVRGTRLIEQGTTWEHQVLPTRDPATLDAIWHEWAVHESIKRYLSASLFSESSGISILIRERSIVWFAWRIATIKRILFTFRCRRCFRQTSFLRVYRATTNSGQQRLRLSGRSYFFSPPIMVALRNGCVGRRCFARSPQSDSRDRI